MKNQCVKCGKTISDNKRFCLKCAQLEAADAGLIGADLEAASRQVQSSLKTAISKLRPGEKISANLDAKNGTKFEVIFERRHTGKFGVGIFPPPGKDLEAEILGMVDSVMQGDRLTAPMPLGSVDSGTREADMAKIAEVEKHLLRAGGN